MSKQKAKPRENARASNKLSFENALHEIEQIAVSDSLSLIQCDDD